MKTDKTERFTTALEAESHRCQAKFLTSRHIRMHRATFYISNTLRKLMI